jgi:hypothetical protein
MDMWDIIPIILLNIWDIGYIPTIFEIYNDIQPYLGYTTYLGYIGYIQPYLWDIS